MTTYDDNRDNLMPQSMPQPAPTPTRDQRRAARGPDYVGYTLKDRGEGKDPFWLAIGGAWSHDDGRGLTLQLDAAPLDGKVTLREKRRAEYEAKRSQPSTASNRDYGPQR